MRSRVLHNILVSTRMIVGLDLHGDLICTSSQRSRPSAVCPFLKRPALPAIVQFILKHPRLPTASAKICTASWQNQSHHTNLNTELEGDAGFICCIAAYSYRPWKCCKENLRESTRNPRHRASKPTAGGRTRHRHATCRAFIF